MRRRWLTGLAGLALCVAATEALAQVPAPAPPPAVVPPAQPVAPPAPPAVVAPAQPVAPPAAPPSDAPPPAPPAPVGTRPRTPAPTASTVGAFANPPPAAPTPLARRWWFWAAVGGAAVGLVLGAIMLSPREPYEGNASPGVTSPF